MRLGGEGGDQGAKSGGMNEKRGFLSVFEKGSVV
jgi:hypothetical protein